MAESCASCKYALQAPEALYCRRNPPQVAFVPVQDRNGNVMMAPRSTFPPVLVNWSCGEYRKGLILPITAQDERLAGAAAESRA
jgi:hypothetical protein